MKTGAVPTLPRISTPVLASEIHVSGVSTGNSPSATASAAASGLRRLSHANPAHVSVSATPDQEYDDLELSQFPFVHVASPLHRASFDDEAPLSLEVELDDLEVSFTNLTQQYAPLVQAPLAGGQLGTALAIPLVVGGQPSVEESLAPPRPGDAASEQPAVDSPPRSVEATPVGNPST